MKQTSVLLLPILLLACGEVPEGNNEQEPIDASRAAFSEVNTVVPGTIFASIDPQAGFEAIQDTAKAACGDEAICKVVVFPAGSTLPKAFPMTEREASETIANFTLNRNSGMDELMAKCPEVPNTPDGQCFSGE